MNRALGVEQIIEISREHAGMPIVATGDFNALPDDPVISRMTAHFTDVWDEVGEGPGYTIPVPAARATRRIDYIFYTNDLVEEGGPTLRAIRMEVDRFDRVRPPSRLRRARVGLLRGRYVP